MRSIDNHNLSPWEILGLTSEQSNLEVIRQRYLEKIKEFPPEKDPVRFEQLRDAYLELRKQCQSASSLRLDVDPLAPLASLLPNRELTREFVGPQPWRAVLEG